MLVHKRRDMAAALKLFRKLLKNQGITKSCGSGYKQSKNLSRKFTHITTGPSGFA